MKRIGLLSDTHGYLDPKIYTYFESVDEIWHAGDIGSIEVLDKLKKFKPTRAVYGNIDNHVIRMETQLTEVFEIEGLKVCMTHIAGRPERIVPEALGTVQKHKPGLFICGHSHIALVKFEPKHQMMWMNPGACGVKGFHKVRTVFRFVIDAGKCAQLEVIEFAERYPTENEK